MSTVRSGSRPALIAVTALALQVAYARAPGITRSDLQRHDLGVPGREVVQGRVDFAPGDRPGQEEELARRLAALAEASRSDRGVIAYVLHRSTTDPASWLTYERYQSQEHFDAHRQNPVLRRFIADGAAFLDGKLDVRTFGVVSD